ncbi:MAG: RNA methyltransferase [Bacteroidota bacterium]
MDDLPMRPERLEKIKNLVRKRQLDLTVVLENVHDAHNIGAVMRSCDAVGIGELYICYSSDRLNKSDVVLGKRTSAGARKWVDVHYFEDTESCFEQLKKKYSQILGTHLTEESKSLYQLDLTMPTALVFGNEHRGISQEALRHLTGNFIIPQFGMVESLNISVACAVSLFEAARQRNAKHQYNNSIEMGSEREALLNNYIQRHIQKHTGRDPV